MIDWQFRRWNRRDAGRAAPVAITDAVGQVSTIQYAHPTDPLKITRVTDRSAGARS